MKCKEAGIPTVVWLTPILPFINDTADNIKNLLDACVDAGVKGIIFFGIGVTLRDGDREYFYHALDKDFPGMKENISALTVMPTTCQARMKNAHSNDRGTMPKGWHPLFAG